MDDCERLNNIAAWRKRKNFNKEVCIGQTVKSLLEKQISPKQAKYGQVLECWEALLPEQLASHCRIDEISNGQIKVIADSAIYASELRWCSEEILNQLKRQCPSARLQKISVVVG